MSAGPWIAWSDGWPGWRDGGRPVEIEVGGKKFSGRLIVEPDCQDEIECFLKLADGSVRSFADNDRWRFLDE